MNGDKVLIQMHNQPRDSRRKILPIQSRFPSFSGKSRKYQIIIVFYLNDRLIHIVSYYILAVIFEKVLWIVVFSFGVPSNEIRKKINKYYIFVREKLRKKISKNCLENKFFFCLQSKGKSFSFPSTLNPHHHFHREKGLQNIN